MPTPQNEMEGLDTTVSVHAINREDREIMLEDGTILPMTCLHDATGEETDDMEEAVFATVELPDGRWVPVVLEDYDQPRVLN
jgi:hypothetical protein